MARGKRVLIMGLPGAGKTYLAEEVMSLLGEGKVSWFNADKIREEYDDWDFSPEGRERQAKRMAQLSEMVASNGTHCICDFVCPTEELRNTFNADIVVWMDTIEKGRFNDTNLLFQKPESVDIHITEWSPENKYRVEQAIEPYVWDNKAPTVQMLGRWQPWHKGHQTLFEEALKRAGQVQIMVRDVQGVDGKNPFDFDFVSERIQSALYETYGERFKVMLVPNLEHIIYGRDVGYKIEEVVLPKDIQEISATKIRKEMGIG